MEIWKDIPDYEGYYQASNFGHIRSVPRKDRLGRNTPAIQLKPWLQNGYPKVTLWKYRQD